MSGLSHISGTGHTPHPFHLDQFAAQEQAEVRFEFGNGHGLALPVDLGKVYRFSPHGDRLEFPAKMACSPAKKASSRLGDGMRMLAGAGRTAGTAALGLGKALSHYPIAITGGALVFGRMMKQWGLPDLPAQVFAKVAEAGGQQMLSVAHAGGKQAANALVSTLTSKEGLAVAGGSGVLVALRNALKDPGAARQRLAQFGTGVIFAVLTAASALQQRATRHP